MHGSARTGDQRVPFTARLVPAVSTVQPLAASERIAAGLILDSLQTIDYVAKYFLVTYFPGELITRAS